MKISTILIFVFLEFQYRHTFWEGPLVGITRQPQPQGDTYV